jgi:hypothetical protein
MHARMHAHTHTHARTHACMYAHTHARTHASTHARTHARMHARTHARTHARMHARTHAHTHARTHARTKSALLCTVPHVLCTCPKFMGLESIYIINYFGDISNVYIHNLKINIFVIFLFKLNSNRSVHNDNICDMIQI